MSAASSVQRSFIHLLYCHSPAFRVAVVAGANPNCHRGEGRVTHRTSHQFIAGPHWKTNNHSNSHARLLTISRFASHACASTLGGSCRTEKRTQWNPLSFISPVTWMDVYGGQEWVMGYLSNMVTSRLVLTELHKITRVERTQPCGVPQKVHSTYDKIPL